MGVFIKICLFKSPLFRGFSESRISRLCAKLSSETDLHNISLELRRLSSPRRLALFHFALWRKSSRNAENKVYLFCPKRLALFHFRLWRMSSRNAENKDFYFRETDLTSHISATVKMQVEICIIRWNKERKEISTFIRFNRACDWIKCSYGAY